jgi:hypothetical protein
MAVFVVGSDSFDVDEASCEGMFEVLFSWI